MALLRIDTKALEIVTASTVLKIGQEDWSQLVRPTAARRLGAAAGALSIATLGLLAQRSSKNTVGRVAVARRALETTLGCARYCCVASEVHGVFLA